MLYELKCLYRHILLLRWQESKDLIQVAFNVHKSHAWVGTWIVLVFPPNKALCAYIAVS
jgi:hypothetical protein